MNFIDHRVLTLRLWRTCFFGCQGDTCNHAVGLRLNWHGQLTITWYGIIVTEKETSPLILGQFLLVTLSEGNKQNPVRFFHLSRKSHVHSSAQQILTEHLVRGRHSSKSNRRVSETTALLARCFTLVEETDSNQVTNTEHGFLGDKDHQRHIRRTR